MNINTIITNQKKSFLTLNRSAKLWLLVVVMEGVFFAGWELFFNLNILARGFDKEFLGMANSVYPAAVLLFGIPMGILSDRIGRKSSLFIGQAFFLITFLIVALISDPTTILVVLFIGGMGDALYIVSATPLIADLSNSKNRNYLFSMNWGLSTLSRMAGNYLAGQLPLGFENWFDFQSGTAMNYQTVLITCVSLTFLTLIPILMIKLPEKLNKTDENGDPTEEKVANGTKQGLQNILKNKLAWKFFLPNLQIGLGAALIIPYLNLFFVEKFGASDQTLGTLFSAAALATGLSSLSSPSLANKLGTRIRAVVAVQGTSILFLLLLGFSPFTGIAMIAFLVRGALMNMGNPLYESFSMEQVSEEERGALSSILMLSWEIGWAVGPLVSGFVQESYGFTPLFIATAVLYTSGVAFIWHFFRDHESVEMEKAALQST
ncbi:MAG: MFS transporter [Anaerolineales bacterium]|jgi:MFS family permease